MLEKEKKDVCVCVGWWGGVGFVRMHAVREGTDTMGRGRQRVPSSCLFRLRGRPRGRKQAG